MKKVLLVLCFIPLFINAQQWNVIMPNEQYHYQLESDSLPLDIVQVDSVKVTGNDSVFYMNRLFGPCLSCGQEGWYEDDLPVFMQREIIKSLDGNRIAFANPDTITLYTKMNIGEEWICNIQKNQKGKIIAKEVKNLFGKSDSVITFLLGDKDSILISKSFGIIQFEKYHLKGLQVANLGVRLPSVNEFCNFSIGDVFQYYYQSGSQDMQEKFVNTDIWNKQTITSVSYSEHKVTLGFFLQQKKSVHIYGEQFPTITYYSDSILSYEIPNYIINLAKAYPGQKFLIGEEYGNYDSIFQQVRIEKVLGKLAKVVGKKEANPWLFSFEGNNLYSPYHGNQYQLDLCVLEGCGLGWFINVHYEAVEGEELIGYKKIGQQEVGEVLPDEFYNSLNDKAEPELLIYPNPAKGECVIQGDFSENLIMRIFDVSGRLCQEKETSAGATLSLGKLNPGIYIVEKKTEDRTVSQKLWIN